MMQNRASVLAELLIVLLLLKYSFIAILLFYNYLHQITLTVCMLYKSTYFLFKSFPF